MGIIRILRAQKVTNIIMNPDMPPGVKITDEQRQKRWGFGIVNQGEINV